MGFRPFDGAPCLFCEVKDRKLIVYLVDGTTEEYETTLNLNFPRQLNIIPYRNVTWVVQNPELLIVGHPNGVFNGFRWSDGVLCKLGTWSNPMRDRGQEIGQYEGYTAWLDRMDKRTIYVSGRREVFRFNTPQDVLTDDLRNYCDRNLPLNTLTIYTEGGDHVDTKDGTWYCAPEQYGPGVQL